MRCYVRVFIIIISVLMFRKVRTWGSDKVLLRDVTALTLHKGQMTTGRRSSPVPQLNCVGGTAGCYKFTPQTVQCRNVGFDGNEVQWECKCDMDDSYRFGKIQVTCEGYDYPDDPYILKGSCGLEYTIDYTETGHAKSNNYAPSWSSSDSDSSGGWIFFFILISVIVFMICKMGGGSHDSRTPYPEPNRPDQRSDLHHSGRNDPPSYGFKREYTQPQPENQPPPPSYSDATQSHSSSSTYTRSNYHRETRNSPNGGGFWSGLGLGGIAGYLFGSRQSNHYYSNPGYGGHWGSSRGWGGNRGWGSSWGNNRGWGSSWGNNGGWGSSSGTRSTTYRRSTGSSSSGTSRTASGFGGTSRR